MHDLSKKEQMLERIWILRLTQAIKPLLWSRNTHICPRQQSHRLSFVSRLCAAPTSRSSLTGWHPSHWSSTSSLPLKPFSLSIRPNSPRGLFRLTLLSCDALSPSVASLMLRGLRVGLKHNYALSRSLQLCGKRRAREGERRRTIKKTPHRGFFQRSHRNRLWDRHTVLCYPSCHTWSFQFSGNSLLRNSFFH